MDILDFIPLGHDNALTLNQLCSRVGRNARDIRALIEKNNIEGDTPIINLMDGAGYFMPTTDEIDLIKQYRISETSRARKLEKKLRNIDRILACVGQEDMNQWLQLVE